MKTPITYYGGKQKLAKTIIKNIPSDHTLYGEPFGGGLAVFFEKEPSDVEVINDTNSELVNFYRVVQNDFVGLEKEIRITLHSRDMFRKASVIYNNPDMFSEIKRAWAVWCLSSQGFAGLLDGSWGYDVGKNTTTKKISNKRASFTEDYAIRLQNVQIECTDAIRIIRSRDSKSSFFYCDPPYVGSDCGHYDGYSQEDFDGLLKILSRIKGKFLLSSYPNSELKGFKAKYGWHQLEIDQTVSVANSNSTKGRKAKKEVLTANYPLIAP
jgi:DNA adenine methylase